MISVGTATWQHLILFAIWGQNPTDMKLRNLCQGKSQLELWLLHSIYMTLTLFTEGDRIQVRKLSGLRWRFSRAFQILNLERGYIPGPRTLAMVGRAWSRKGTPSFRPDRSCPDGTWLSRKFSTFVQTAVPGLFCIKIRPDRLKLPHNATLHYAVAGRLRNGHINTLDKVVTMEDRFYWTVATMTWTWNKSSPSEFLPRFRESFNPASSCNCLSAFCTVRNRFESSGESSRIEPFCRQCRENSL